jgi:hypothetical protein
MKKLTHPLRRMLDLAQRRFIRSRSGSVLILVVALLVLMALIGTAFMTMAQFDRVAAVQHSANTEVDLLVEGVINQVKGVVGGDLFVSGLFRPAVNSTVVAPAVPPQYNSNQPSSYNYYNGVGYNTGTAQVTAGAAPGNWWLAARLPVLVNEAAAPSQVANPPGWSFLTGAINGSGVYNDPTSTFAYSVRSRVFPCMSGGYPFTGTKTQYDGQYWPALYYVDPVTGAKITFMAADADGDGVADSGFVKLLTLEGITYYAAVRIVDNAAAINASIAFKPNPITTFVTGSPTGMPGDFSPVNLDLEGMLVTPSATPPADMYGPASANGPGLLTNYRFNNIPLLTTTPVTAPVGDLPAGTGTARTDFQFLLYTDPASTYYDSFDLQWTQLGRRLRNPGYIVTGTKFQALGVSENMTMARGFVLRDPSVTSATTSSSILEQRMPNTLFNQLTPNSGPKSAPYTPDNAITWFTDNFNFFNDYTTGINTMPMRALTVGLNPVSNFAPGKFHDVGAAAVTYAFGDMITYNNHRYVCINPGTVTVPREPSSAEPYWQDPNWAFEPWKTAPTKTSANTGTFQQLYAAYWAVMADQYVPAVGATPAQWNPAFPLAPSTEARMFRSPIRSGYTPTGPEPAPPFTTPGLTPQQTMYLRAALAAVNTMDLRDADNDVTSRTIYIPNATGTPQYKVNVYGTEKQPYLTHIYARNDAMASNDFIAVEFYNPYNVAIDISNWKLGIVDRKTPAQLTVASLDGSALGQPLKTMVTTPAPLTTIGAKSFIVLLSSNTTISTVKVPSPLPTNFYQCTNLTNAFGKELVLLRPRRTDGMVIAGTMLNNLFDETMPSTATNLTGLYDYIPIDSYDFTKITPIAADPTTPQEWEYRRPDLITAVAATNKNWHFVYPGPWQYPANTSAVAASLPSWSATAVTPKPIAQTDLGVANLGTSNPAAITGFGAAIYPDVTIQVNNTDFGGPLKPTTAGPNYQPLGAFLRNGDLLQVTYIGAYKIVDITSATTPKLVELNSISADSAMATAQDFTNSYTPIAAGGVTAENIGRFCPIDNTDATSAGVATVNDYAAATTGWRYHWATRLFDFLTVQQPGDDYLPDVDPWRADLNYGYAYRYPPANNGTTPPPIPQAVSNVSGTANTGLDPTNLTTFVPPTATEETAPVDGLVNINTAPWRVLAAVPWVPATVGGFRATNAAIAQAIVKYRDIDDGSGTHPHGPFKSIFELNSVVYGGGKLRDVLGTPANASDYTVAQGNLSPLDPTAGTDQVIGDFESLFNMVTRVSNLVTTRSDSYTAYILVQGWKNAETVNAHLVVQRRAAIIIDRSTVTPTNPTPSAVNVPLNQ